MLLQRLVDYRAPSDGGDDEDSRPYSRERVVRWELNLGADGGYLGLVDLADGSDRATKFGQRMVVPNGGRTSGIAPALGADDAQYVLGWQDKDAKPERVRAAHTSFVELSRRWLQEAPDDPAAQALVAFYDRGGLPPPPEGKKWSSKDLVVVTVDDEQVTDRDSLWALWQTVVQERKSGGGPGGEGAGRHGMCLVCGRHNLLLDRMPQALPKALVPRAEQEIALLSANKRIHTYDFTEGLSGSPICVGCGQAAVANLHTLLLGDKSVFRFRRQRTLLAWWVTGGAGSRVISLLNETSTDIRDYLRTLTTGRPVRRPESETFCSVTVSGNVARLVINRWLEMPLRQAEENVERWFQDHRILTRGQDEPAAFSVWLLLLSAGQWLPDNSPRGGRYVGLDDKAADRPDDLGQTLLHNALNGGWLPPQILAHIVRRIRTDLHIDGPRMALLRVALTRHPHREGEGPAPMLDEKQDNPAYLSGRLFAVLESLQRSTYPKDELPNTTFFHRYFAGAVTNPRVALVQGCQLYPAWLKKLDSAAQERHAGPAMREKAERARRAASRYRARIRELYDRLGKAVEPLADVESQSWFVLGYFHQQAHDIRMAKAGKAPEVPLDELAADADEDLDTIIDEGNDEQ